MLRAPASSHCPLAKAIAGLSNGTPDCLTSFSEIRNVDDQNVMTRAWSPNGRTPARCRGLFDSTHKSPNRRQSLENPDEQRGYEATRLRTDTALPIDDPLSSIAEEIHARLGRMHGATMC